MKDNPPMPYNRLSPRDAELLAWLAEECGEVVQAIGKVLRHGWDGRDPTRDGSNTNRRNLEKELGDVARAVITLADVGGVDDTRIKALSAKKPSGRWLHEQEPPRDAGE
jgi:NTP pyrophosphatase (non-canonical NTP hydrolase)